MSDISSAWVSYLSSVPTHCLEAEAERRRLEDQPPAPVPDPSVPAYRLVVDVLSHNGDVDTVGELRACLETLRHPEFLSVVEVRQRDLPSFTDDHPINKHATQNTFSDEWFKDAPVVWRREEKA